MESFLPALAASVAVFMLALLNTAKLEILDVYDTRAFVRTAEFRITTAIGSGALTIAIISLLLAIIY